LVYLPDTLHIPSGLYGALLPIWPQPAPVVYAILLFFIAMPCFALAVLWSGSDPPIPSYDVAPPRIARPLIPTATLLIVGLALLGWVLVKLGTTPYDPAYPRWYALSVIILLAALIYNERLLLGALVRSCAGWRRSHLLEATYVAIATGAFLWLSSWDLGSWYYSAIGDEHSFFYMARDFADGHIVRNLFTQQGVYDIIPMMSSYVEGKLMMVLGTTGPAWKESVIVQAAASLVLLYFLARALYGYRVAVLALGMLATAHYLLAYAHTGYDTLETLPPTVGALLCFVQGLRKQSTFILALSGAAAALGWYTYYPSRTAIFILAGCVLVCARPRSWLQVGFAILGGFLLVFLPLLVVNTSAVISSMLSQTGSGPTTEAVADRALLPLWNTGRSLMAFNYNMHSGPYVYGSLAEPVTALLFALGLGYCLASWRDMRSRLLLMWFVPAITATGILSKYDYVSVSRLNYLLPVVVLLAAVACDRACSTLESLSPERRRPLLVWTVVVAVLGAATFGNLHRWFVEDPANLPSTPEALAIRVIAQPVCMTKALPLLVSDTLGGEILPALDARGIPNHVALGAYTDVQGWIDTMPSRCVIFRARYDPVSVTIMAEIAHLLPEERPTIVYDRTGQFSIVVYYPLHGPSAPGAK
jgi:hypothetical protein